jgi:L-ascorbate peroxidase
MMGEKGFSPADTAALVGAHSVSRQQFVDENRKDTPQDSTPGIADVSFYNETLNPSENILAFETDKNLASDPASSPAWNSFIGRQE